LRRWLHYHLKLVIMLEPIGILAIATVRGPPGRLNIGDIPGLRPEHPEESGRVEGPSPLFRIVGLLNDASLSGPIALKREYHVLKGHSGPPEFGKLTGDKSHLGKLKNEIQTNELAAKE
jgi:hypothetical protein